jgi:hypothetical protein
MVTTTASPPGYEFEPTAGGTVVERRMKRISWAGVWAGLFVALAIQISLTLLAFGIGLAFVEPWNTEATTVGVSSGIFLLISCILSLFAGGWVAARIAGVPRQTEKTIHGGMIHGLVTWSFATVVFTFLLMNWLGAMFLITTQVAADVATAAPSASSTALMDMSAQVGASAAITNIKEEAQDLMEGREPNQSASNVPMETSEMDAERINQLVDRLVHQGDRETMVNTLIAYTEMSRTEAIQTVQRWLTGYRQAGAPATAPVDADRATEQRMNAVAIRLADWISAASLWGFFAVLLSAVAAALGGVYGGWDMRIDYVPPPGTTRIQNRAG